MKLQSAIHQLGSLTRAKDWRLNFVPFVIACVYLWINLFKIALSLESLIVFLLSILTTVGFAALGYFINEFFDKKQDLAAGKINKLSLLSAWQQLSLLLLILSTCLLPWFFLPKDITSYILIGIEIGLFIVYAAPGIRLKESLMLSLLVDSAYAYLVPCLLSFHTYALLSGGNHAFFPWFFFITLLFVGIRNMLLHQIKDVLGDQKAGFRSVPQFLGVKRTQQFLRVLIFLEITFLLASAIELSYHQQQFVLWLIVVFLYVLQSLQSLREILKENAFFDLMPVRHFLDLLYILWFPLCQLFLLIFVDWKWLILLPVHLLFFVDRGHLLKFSQLLWHNTTKPFLSALVNYPIYFTFKLFGVDLRKEKVSAFQFIKAKLKA